MAVVYKKVLQAVFSFKSYKYIHHRSSIRALSKEISCPTPCCCEPAGMGKKRTVMKMSISNKKDQKEIVTAVAKIPGVEKLEIDPSKGTLTVVGEVEPVPLFKALTKIGKNPEIMTVGPPRPQRCSSDCYCTRCRPYSDQQNTCDCPPVSQCHPYCNKACCRPCEIVSVRYDLPHDPNPGQCSIL